MKKLIFISLLFIFSYNLNAQKAKMVFGKVVLPEIENFTPYVIISQDNSFHYAVADTNDGSFKLFVGEKSTKLNIYINGFFAESVVLQSNKKEYIIKPSLTANNKSVIEVSKGDRDKDGSGGTTTSIGVHSADYKRPFKLESGFEGDGSKGSSVEVMLSGGTAIMPKLNSGIVDFPIDEGRGGPAEESGLLTAGELNDFSKWQMWNDLSEGELSKYKDVWEFYPFKRYSIQIENEFKAPVYNAKVKLLHNDFVIWSSITDNTGKAELWINPFTNLQEQIANFTAEIEYNGQFTYINNLKEHSQGINFISLKTGCLKPQMADIAFVIDATGSMGDEINYLKLDIQDIMKKIKDTVPQINFNLGAVFYRDTTDEYITKYTDFNSDVNIISDFIGENYAAGGGDYPEAVHRALDVTVNQMSWRDEAFAKVVFLVLDAPPHSNIEVVRELQQYIHKAAQMGIRIIPLACSGVDKSTEFILRSMAILTNGTYTFLTDDSGIGNPHIKPSTDEYDVETLKDLLIRLVYQYTYYPECETIYPLLVNDTLDVKLPDTGVTTEDSGDALALKNFKYYPNPTFGKVNIELIGKAEELFVADISGKIILRLDVRNKTNLEMDLSPYPSGMYLLMYQYSDDKWAKGKILLMH